MHSNFSKLKKREKQLKRHIAFVSQLGILHWKNSYLQNCKEKNRIQIFLKRITMEKSKLKKKMFVMRPENEHVLQKYVLMRRRYRFECHCNV
ncbi:hypothetical protein T4D_9545 [Trichinella pseudospiralis]|uniref:Uncharacterized protein n=1 Tax=Trichinella pseudospiralis TaxID=6337 RepID=A0A0V1G0D2_TRIPS|nr:hypothetical protein T4D_9545 [Trichinella pseudospiralis]